MYAGDNGQGRGSVECDEGLRVSEFARADVVQVCISAADFCGGLNEPICTGTPLSSTSVCSENTISAFQDLRQRNTQVVDALGCFLLYVVAESSMTEWRWNAEYCQAANLHRRWAEFLGCYYICWGLRYPYIL